LTPIITALEAGSAPIPAFGPAQQRGEPLERDQALAWCIVVQRQQRGEAKARMCRATRYGNNHNQSYEWRAL
jgi:hypothetical protein